MVLAELFQDLDIGRVSGFCFSFAWAGLAINDRIKNRIITIAIILFFFGSIIILLVFVRQNLDLMKKQYSSIETFSNKLIQSVATR